MKRVAGAPSAVIFSAFVSVAALACSVVEIPQTVTRNISLQITQRGVAVPGASFYVIRWVDGDPVIVKQGKGDERGRVLVDNLAIGQYDIVSSIWPPYAWRVLVNATGKDGTTEFQASFSTEREMPAPIELATFDGIVTDPTGALIPKAAVVIEGTDSRHTPVAAITTDESGKIHANLRPGIYTLRVGIMGFETAVVPIHITDHAHAWKRFRLALKVGSSCGFPDPHPYTLTELD